MSGQLDIFDYVPALPNLHFAGETYNPTFDCERLSDQQRRVWEAMKDGAWRTFREIEAITGDTHTSISSRLRDFNNREPLKGHFLMESRRRGDPKLGVWEYRVSRRDACRE